MTALRSAFLFLWLAIGSATVSGIQLDPSFGDRGYVFLPTSAAQLTALALQSDGRIIGLGNVSGGEGILLFRCTRNGALDPTFGDGGVATSFASSQALGYAIAIQPDGRIVVAGSLRAGTSSFLVARYNSDGSLDPSFGGGGFVTTGFTAEGDGASAVGLQADGRIVVAGGGGPGSPFVAHNFEAARYEVDGNLDSSFGANGLAIVDMGGTSRGVVLEPDGRIVLGGTSNGPSGHSRIALLGLLASGAMDPDFGAAGKVFTEVSTDSGCEALALQSDGKILAAGSAYPTGMLVVARYAPDGSLDAGFGASGIVTVPGGPSVSAMIVDHEGRVDLAGSIHGMYALERLLSDGRPDPVVGPEGWTSVLGGSPPNIQASATAIAVQPDGGIILGGNSTFEIVSPIALVRYAGAAVTIPALSGIAAILLAAALGVAGVLATRRLA